jgi:hypothetical protein
VPQYVAPSYQTPKFTCPQCGTLAEQHWTNLLSAGSRLTVNLDSFQWCVCQSCERPSLWLQPSLGSDTVALGQMVWPVYGGPPPHDEMPAEALRHYEQARRVFGASPQAAAALLRVATQAIVNHLLGRDDLTLDKAIAQLAKEGLIRTGVKQACDVLRVTGNNMLHPGQISESEDANQEVAERLFQLVNLIVEQAITEPALIERLYADLPPEKRAAIEIRDRRVAAEQN